MKTLKFSLNVLIPTLIAVGGVYHAGASIYTINDGGLDTVNVTIDTTSYNGALAGGILVNPVGPGSSFITVCTDIEGTLYLGQNYTYNAPVNFADSAYLSGVKPNWGADNASSTAKVDLTSAAYAIQNAATIFYANYSVLQTGTTAQKAGVQIAIWDVLYNTDSTGAITGTRFGFSADGDPTAIADANNLIAGIALVPANLGDFDGQILVPNPLDQGNGDGEPPQELLYYVTPGNTSGMTPVPEASTVIAGLLLLLPFGTSAFKIMRKKRSV